MKLFIWREVVQVQIVVVVKVGSTDREQASERRDSLIEKGGEAAV